VRCRFYLRMKPKTPSKRGLDGVYSYPSWTDANLSTDQSPHVVQSLHFVPGRCTGRKGRPSAIFFVSHCRTYTDVELTSWPLAGWATFLEFADCGQSPLWLEKRPLGLKPALLSIALRGAEAPLFHVALKRRSSTLLLSVALPGCSPLFFRAAVPRCNQQSVFLGKSW
jgi:hypothetical protein